MTEIIEIKHIAGSVIGGLIGFVDAFFCGLIVAWLYNVFCHCGNKDGGKGCK